jgi:hypothetical protein
MLVENTGRLGCPSILGRSQVLEIFPETDCMNSTDAEEPWQVASDVTAATRTLWKEQQENLHVYRCPTCEKKHLVNEARHRLAYGRQLTCSCVCEVQRRKKVKMKWRNMQRHP